MQIAGKTHDARNGNGMIVTQSDETAAGSPAPQAPQLSDPASRPRPVPRLDWPSNLFDEVAAA
ncbi:MAG: hypothetical protein U1E70_27405 [Acetobacteraceae bacterium]